jgi:hypothetical protein
MQFLRFILCCYKVSSKPGLSFMTFRVSVTFALCITLPQLQIQSNAVFNAVYVPPLPMSHKELRDRITHALQTITADMLHRVWAELDYRMDVCRVTQGAHIEGL